MSEPAAYVGVWFNYNKGAVFGSTLTLPAQYGAFLVAFLALYVKWTGEHFWGILRFAIHQWRTTSEPKDALYHQQQIILRNESAEISTIWRLIQLSLSWRSTTHAPLRRNLLLIFTSAIHALGFFAAGIFSSRVTKTYDEALVRSDRCGWPRDPEIELDVLSPSWKAGLDVIDSLFVYGHAMFTRSSTLARACYDNRGGQNSSLCDDFVIPYLRSTINRSAPCPFAEGVCKTAAISMDTGLFHSDVHLGMNRALEDRISFRRVTSCAPISADERYSTPWTEEVKPGYFPNGPVHGDSFKYYYMGSGLFFGFPTSEFSYAVSNYSRHYAADCYILWCLSSYVGNMHDSGFQPIAELNRTDADVNLLALVNGAVYTGKVTDPWFEATVETQSSLGSKVGGGKQFVSSHALNVVGCTEQYQLCNQAGKCTPLSGIYAVNSSISALELTPNQFATAKMILKAAKSMTLFDQTIALGHSHLVANDYSYGMLGISPALRPTQWQTEMENMHNISLAILQLLMVQYASPWDLDVRPGLTTLDCLDVVNNTAANSDRWLCNDIKIRSNSYSSFSMLGLMLILGLGSIIIMLDQYLTDIVFWCWKGREGKKRRTGDTTISQVRQRTWQEGDLLQLQRLAYEGRGISPWENRGEVPVTVQFAKSFHALEEDSWIGRDGEEGVAHPRLRISRFPVSDNKHNVAKADVSSTLTFYLN